MRLRDLPSVDELARTVDDPLAVDAARTVLARAREAIGAGSSPGDLAALLRAELRAARAPRLRRVLNATGVLVHTNLGRAPLPAPALERVVEVGRGYSNLEYDSAAGRRGSRQEHVAEILRRLTGAEAALVVNNNAGAVLLALSALAEGGTTNRTRAADYRRALTSDTAVLLRVHQSNFRLLGFTERPGLRELAEIAQSSGLSLVDDLGSGAFAALGDEPQARD